MNADPRIGKRVELAPHTDLWMRGARYGDFVRVAGRKAVNGYFACIKLDADRTRGPRIIHSDNFRFLD